MTSLNDRLAEKGVGQKVELLEKARRRELWRDMIAYPLGDAPREEEIEEGRLKERSEDDGTLVEEIVDVMRLGQVTDTRGLKRVDRKVLREWTRRVSGVIMRMG